MDNKEEYYDVDELRTMYEGAYCMKMKPDLLRSYKEGYVFDENKSVKWNREEVERLNGEYDEECKRLRSLRNSKIDEVENEIFKYISNETGLSIDKSKLVWKYLYEKYHAFCSDLFDNLETLTELIYEVTRDQSIQNEKKEIKLENNLMSIAEEAYFGRDMYEDDSSMGGFHD